MEWALVGGVRQRALASGLRGKCPGCGGEVIGKCGEKLTWHWAHVASECSDLWWEGESDWHREWKSYFPDEWQEVVMGPHRADIGGPGGVIEVQRSPLDSAAIREREEFYGRMIWILNGHDFWQNLVWIEPYGDLFRFRWKRRRVSWEDAKRPIAIDTPLGLFGVKRVRNGSWFVLEGKFVSPQQIMRWIDPSGNTEPDARWVELDAERSIRRERLIKYAAQLERVVKDINALFLRGYGYANPDNVMRSTANGPAQEWYRVLPAATPVWFRAVDVREYVLESDIDAVAVEVEQWLERVRILSQYAQQQDEAKTKASKAQAERDAKHEQERLAREEESRRQFEAYKRRLEQEEVARKKEAAIAAAKDAAELYMNQARLMELEWRRPAVIGKFLELRQAPPGGMGAFSAVEIQGFIASISAARDRLAAKTGQR